MNAYHIIVFEAEEGGYWAEVVELRGVSDKARASTN